MSDGSTPGPRGHKGEQGEPGHDKDTPFERVAVFVVVLITAISAIYFAVQAHSELDHATRQRDCQQVLIEDTIAALRARSTFAETQARATLKLSVAQETFLTTDPEASDAARHRAFVTYLAALHFNIASTEEQLRVRIANPYPTQTQVMECER